VFLTLAQQRYKAGSSRVGGDEMSNPQARRLHESLVKHAGTVVADTFMATHPLTKSPSWKVAHEWAESICKDLESSMDKALVQAIRRDCACGPALGYKDEIRRVYRESMDSPDFVRRFNEAGFGPVLQLDGDDFLFEYRQCSCSFVKHVDSALPVSWCACTLGYAEKLFGHVLDKEVSAVLLESIKTGGKRCVIRIS
jgi:hypothetical protein